MSRKRNGFLRKGNDNSTTTTNNNTFNNKCPSLVSQSSLTDTLFPNLMFWAYERMPTAVSSCPTFLLIAMRLGCNVIVINSMEGHPEAAMGVLTYAQNNKLGSEVSVKDD